MMQRLYSRVLGAFFLYFPKFVTLIKDIQRKKKKLDFKGPWNKVAVAMAVHYWKKI